MKKINHASLFIALGILATLSVSLIISCAKETPISVSGGIPLEERAPIKYNEGLSTILRGIITDRYSRNQKYYKMREFRVFNNPNQKCITLNILKNYGEFANGNSILPSDNEKYVFNRFDTLIIQPSYRIYQVRDAYNNVLKINMNLIDSLPSCWNTSATLTNKPLVKVTTQTYNSSVHNTCGIIEPLWTVVK